MVYYITGINWYYNGIKLAIIETQRDINGIWMGYDMCAMVKNNKCGIVIHPIVGILKQKVTFTVYQSLLLIDLWSCHNPRWAYNPSFDTALADLIQVPRWCRVLVTNANRERKLVQLNRPWHIIFINIYICIHTGWWFQPIQKKYCISPCSTLS